MWESRRLTTLRASTARYRAVLPFILCTRFGWSLFEHRPKERAMKTDMFNGALSLNDIFGARDVCNNEKRRKGIE
jgi:hypothetical protein